MKGKRPVLNRRQVAHARFCQRLRNKFSQKATAARLKIDPSALRRYILGLEVPLEDWLEGKRGGGHMPYTK